MSTLDQINRTCTVEILPDMRKKVTRRYDIVDGQATMKDGTKFDANVKIPWGTEDDEYEGCRLTHQDVTGQTGNPNKTPNDPPAFLIRVFEEIDEEDETQVGEPNVTYDQDGNLNVEINWIQFSTGTPVNEVVGTTAAPAPYATAILKEQIDTDDGTLRTIKRIYNGDRTLSDVQNLRFGGKVIVRTIVAIGVIPPTPAGFSLVGPGVLHPDGREIYTYEFAAAAGGGTPGTSGQISIEYSLSQGGDVDFNPASPNTSDGVTRAVIQWVTPLSVTTNPIPTPSGFILIGIDQKQDTGYVLWTGTYARGQGIVDTINDTKFNGALLLRTITSLNAVPSTPGGYTLVTTDLRTEDGYDLYRYTFARGIGQQISQEFTNSQGGNTAFNPASPNSATGEVVCTTRWISAVATTGNPITQPTGFVLFGVDVQDEDGYRMWTTKAGFGGGDEIVVDVQGQSDGALIYTVSQNDDNGNLVPAYPGSGTAYNTKLTHTRDNGFFRNVAVWHKPPATITFRKMRTFMMPGVAAFSGVPVLYNLTPPVSMEILASVAVSYGTTQDTTAPFTVSAYARLNTQWIPYTNPGVAPTPGSPPADPTVGPPVGFTESLGGYLAQSSGISDTDQFFNGVFVATYESTLASSTPSTRPTGSTVIDVDNDPYLVDITGTVVYRRMVTSYSF